MLLQKQQHLRLQFQVFLLVLPMLLFFFLPLCRCRSVGCNCWCSDTTIYKGRDDKRIPLHILIQTTLDSLRAAMAVLAVAVTQDCCRRPRRASATCCRSRCGGRCPHTLFVVVVAVVALAVVVAAAALLIQQLQQQQQQRQQQRQQQAEVEANAKVVVVAFTL